GLDARVACDLVEVDIARRRLGLERSEPAAPAQIGGRALAADVGSMRRTDGQSDVELPQEAEADPAPPFDVDAQLVPARHLAELDASALEQLGHLIGAAAGVELDLCGRGVHGLDLDATGRAGHVGRQVGGSPERLAADAL